MRPLAILGSTGSIGTQTLDIVRKFPDEFKVVALTANKNTEMLQEQINEFQPLVVGIGDQADESQVKTQGELAKGMDGLLKAVTLGEVHTVINGLVGSIGVQPTIKAIENLKNVALANKETLVTAGEVVMKKLAYHKTKLFPIDSEHSAILQCLQGHTMKDVQKMTLTCSGGPFKDTPSEELAEMKADDALKHPTWKMGAKITIDSATLMNKGFEIIETRWLFDVPYDKIDVVIHPQSIVHSMVEYNDQSVIAQMGVPDMRIPIQYALMYPNRVPNENLPPLTVDKMKNLTFDEPDYNKFTCLKLAKDAGIAAGTMPAVLNAANEIAVQAFLDGKVGYLDIPRLIGEEMDAHQNIQNPRYEDILEVDETTRKKVQDKVQ